MITSNRKWRPHSLPPRGQRCPSQWPRTHQPAVRSTPGVHLFKVHLLQQRLLMATHHHHKLLNIPTALLSSHPMLQTCSAVSVRLNNRHLPTHRLDKSLNTVVKHLREASRPQQDVLLCHSNTVPILNRPTMLARCQPVPRTTSDSRLDSLLHRRSLTQRISSVHSLHTSATRSCLQRLGKVS